MNRQPGMYLGGLEAKSLGPSQPRSPRTLITPVLPCEEDDTQQEWLVARLMPRGSGGLEGEKKLLHSLPLYATLACFPDVQWRAI